MSRHRSGMATVTVEVEVGRPGTLRLRVRTEDDTQSPSPAHLLGPPFHEPDAALAYLREWLNRWISAA
jgi:hypothetical protein